MAGTGDAWRRRLRVYERGGGQRVLGGGAAAAADECVAAAGRRGVPSAGRQGLPMATVAGGGVAPARTCDRLAPRWPTGRWWRMGAGVRGRIGFTVDVYLFPIHGLDPFRTKSLRPNPNQTKLFISTSNSNQTN